ncbi:hypothetical protein HZS_6841, partial [Henneguya salminicola]
QKSCPKNALECSNGGHCVKSIIRVNVLISGKEFFCENPCNINYGTCVGPNKCKCSVGYKSGKYCNETRCDTDNSKCLNGGKKY